MRLRLEHPRRARAGLTILEVVLAMGLLAMGLAAILTIFTSAAGLGTSAGRRAEAASALEFVVAEVNERLFPVDESGRPLEPAIVERAPVPGSDRLTYSARAMPVALPPGPGLPVLYRVEVAIHWSEQGRERALEHVLLLPGAVPIGERLRRETFGVPPIESTAPPAEEGEDEPEDDAPTAPARPGPSSERTP